MEVVVIEYFLLPKQTLVFRLLPNEYHPRLIKLPIGREQIKVVVGKLRDSIIQCKPSYEVAHEVYSVLIDKVITDLPEQITHLVIIPHGELHHLPFIALWSGDEYLGQRFTISQIPSLQSLHYIRERPRQTTTPCLAVGTAPNNPVFIQRSFEGEATDVARRFGVHPILGVDAHRNCILPLLSNAEILHFVAHGRFVYKNALHSGLKLSSTPQPEGSTQRSKVQENSYLMARDFLKCGLNATLVVLSACQTGLSKIHPGDELEGLTQALLYAGAASVVVSLWEVDTIATREFMRAFYDSWKTDGHSKAEALQKACEYIRQLSLSQIVEVITRELPESSDADRLRIYFEMGCLYFITGWLHEAKHFYTKALQLATSMNFNLDSALIKECLSYVLIRMNRKVEGQSLLNEAQQAIKYLSPRIYLWGPVRYLDRDGLTERMVHSGEKDPHSVRPWSAPYFWAPFVLVGDWL